MLLDLCGTAEDRRREASKVGTSAGSLICILLLFHNNGMVKGPYRIETALSDPFADRYGHRVELWEEERVSLSHPPDTEQAR